MKDPVDRAIRAIARRNSYALVRAQFGIAHLVAERTPELTIASWRALVTLPKEYVRRLRVYMVERDGIELRGKQAPVRLWAPVGRRESVAGGRERVRAEPVAD